MNQLELTIIANARAALEALKRQYGQVSNLGQGAEEAEVSLEPLSDFYTLHAYLVFAHDQNCGMSQEGRQALSAIEGEHGAAFSSPERLAAEAIRSAKGG